MWTDLLIVALYATCLAGLGAWGVHRLLLLSWIRQHPPPIAKGDGAATAILVQVPVFNESAVVERVSRRGSGAAVARPSDSDPR